MGGSLKPEIRGDDGRLFARSWERVGSVKMESLAFQILALVAVAKQEKSLTKVQTLLCYEKWPTIFVPGGPYGKCRSMRRNISAPCGAKR
jgi:hypothetical protein